MNDNNKPPDNVVDWGGITTHTTAVSRVIAIAKAAGLTSMIVLGETEDGQEFFMSSDPDGPSTLWMLARAQHKLLKVGDD